MRTVITTPTIASEVFIAESYDKVLAEMKAVPDDRVLNVNADITTSVILALAAYAWLMAHKDEIKRQFPELDMRSIELLEAYALALLHANMRYSIAIEPPSNLQALAEEGLTEREKLRADVNTLCVHGVIADSCLKDYRGLTGYKNIAHDLQLLTTAMKESWTQIGGRCMTTLEALERAEKMATQLLRLVGLKEQVVEGSAEAADLRNRAFTLLVGSYDEARRLVGYLRWHEGDADIIAPSFYGGHKQKRGSNKETGEEETPGASSPREPGNGQGSGKAGPPMGDLPGGDPFMS